MAMLAALLGLIAGSFIAALTWRWPRGQSIAAGRSRCDSCTRVLGAGDLVPLLSFLWRRGRCRHCGAAIPTRHLVIELLAAAVGLVTALVAPDPVSLLAGLLFGWWLLALAVLDLEHFWLPRLLTWPLAGLGLSAGLVLPAPGLMEGLAGSGPGVVDRLAGLGLGWAVLAGLAAGYRRLRGRDGLGGGDPPALAAIGAWLGGWALPLVLLGSALIGLAAVAGLALAGRQPGRLTRLPYGTLLATAAWPLWLARPWLQGAGWLP